MGHPDKGLIQASPGWRGAWAGGKLPAVPSCRVRGMHRRSRSHGGGRAGLLRAVLLVDTEPRILEARSRFLARARPGSRRPFWPSISLAKAASIALLLTGAAVTALPGSPVRRWIVQGWEALTGVEYIAPVQEDAAAEGPDRTTPSAGAEVPETGAGIPTSTQGTEVWVYGLPAEAELGCSGPMGKRPGSTRVKGPDSTGWGTGIKAHAPPGTVRWRIPGIWIRWWSV